MLGTFILAVATSTVCATLINQAIVQWREHSGRKETGRLSALYAASVLERYCEQCSHHLFDKENFLRSDGHAGEDRCSLPVLPEYPDAIDWKRLGIQFAEQMFALRTDISAAQSLISSGYAFDPPDGGDRDLLMELSRKGLEAVQLACAIRMAFGLSPTIPGADYSCERHLIESQERRESEHRQFLESQARGLDALLPDSVRDGLTAKV